MGPLIGNHITTVLFDLDGTLLPMHTETFTKAYFKLLAEKAAPYGYEAKALVDAVSAGTQAMVQNDGTCPNDRRFWQTFAGRLGEDVLALRPVFDQFYAQEFHAAKAATRPNPLARQVVQALRGRGYAVILATNPLFPAVGVATRLSWLGLTPGDFLHVTSYENSSFCKPNPAYFTQLLRDTGRQPGECLMVGNNVAEDIQAATRAGLSACLVTDCLENPAALDTTALPQGAFAAFAQSVGCLP